MDTTTMPPAPMTPVPVSAEEGAVPASPVPPPAPMKAKKKRPAKKDGESPSLPDAPPPSAPKESAEDASIHKQKAGNKKKASTEEEAPAKKKAKGTALRSKSAYAFFASEFTSSEAASFAERSKQCGEAWAKLEDKSKYEALAAEDKARVQGERAANAKPKKPLTAFIRFATAERAKIKAAEPDLSFKELSQRCGVAWKAMSKEAQDAWKVTADDAATEVSAA